MQYSDDGFRCQMSLMCLMTGVLIVSVQLFSIFQKQKGKKLEAMSHLIKLSSIHFHEQTFQGNNNTIGLEINTNLYLIDVIGNSMESLLQTS